MNGAKNRVVARLQINEMAATVARRITHLVRDDDGNQWELDRSKSIPGYGESRTAECEDGRTGRFERDKGGTAGVIYGIVAPSQNDLMPPI